MKYGLGMGSVSGSPGSVSAGYRDLSGRYRDLSAWYRVDIGIHQFGVVSILSRHQDRSVRYGLGIGSVSGSIGSVSV